LTSNQIDIFAPGGLLKRLGFAAQNGESNFKKPLNSLKLC